MATTVVSIVIFLCGVLVGRGGRSEVASREAIGTPVNDAGAPVATAEGATGAEVAVPSADPGLEKPTDLSEGDSSYYAMLNGDEAKAAIVPPPAEPESPPASSPAESTPVAPTTTPLLPAAAPGAAAAAPAASPAAASRPLRLRARRAGPSRSRPSACAARPTSSRRN